MDLHYHEAGTGAPLVLLHAFPLSSAMWADVLPGLAGSARVIAPDQRGFGKSPLGTEPPSLDLAADDVAALLDRLGIDRAVVGGLSMGGYVTMAFCRRHADRLAGLLLADTKATADDEATAADRRQVAAEVLGPAGTAALAGSVPSLVGETTERERPAVVERVRAMVTAEPPAAVAWAQHAMAARPDSFDTLRALAVPALVVVGEEDRRSPLADARAMADALPAARLVTLPGCGHLSAVEDPPAFAAAVRAFLSSGGVDHT
jgi:pimeloyl-ACP methyl ester carboxylesterase